MASAATQRSWRGRAGPGAPARRRRPAGSSGLGRAGTGWPQSRRPTRGGGRAGPWPRGRPRPCPRRRGRAPSRPAVDRHRRPGAQPILYYSLAASCTWRLKRDDHGCGEGLGLPGLETFGLGCEPLLAAKRCCARLRETVQHGDKHRDKQSQRWSSTLESGSIFQVSTFPRRRSASWTSCRLAHPKHRSQAKHRSQRLSSGQEVFQGGEKQRRDGCQGQTRHGQAGNEGR